jgi:circadian clock protein KaiC
LTSPRAPLERLTTGSASFDRILGGGVPARSVTVVAGQPGAGKTLFSLQMLFALARAGKKCLYLTTLAEPSLKLLQYMQQFSFFDESLLDSSIVFADLGSVIRRKGADATLSEIASRVEREQPALVAIDSFKAVRDILGDPATLRTFVYDLACTRRAGGRRACWSASTRPPKSQAMPSSPSPTASSILRTRATN